MKVPILSGAALVPEKPNMKTGEKAKLEALKKSQETYEKNKADIANQYKEDIWSFEQGSLTIVDLSCPFVDESLACALFNICIALFLEERGNIGRIVALDEAHKVLFPIDMFISSIASRSRY